MPLKTKTRFIGSYAAAACLELSVLTTYKEQWESEQLKINYKRVRPYRCDDSFNCKSMENN